MLPQFPIDPVLVSTCYCPWFSVFWPSCRWAVRSHCGLASISLIANDVGHLFMCFLAICIFSWEMHLFKSLAYTLLFIFLLLNCTSLFYILGISSEEMCHLQTFPPILWGLPSSDSCLAVLWGSRGLSPSARVSLHETRSSPQEILPQRATSSLTTFMDGPACAGHWESDSEA